MKSFSPRPRSFGIDTSRPASERYKILGRIASGGMAEIYLARMAKRSGGWLEVVLKRLMPDLQADDEFIRMFYDEARIASLLNHPNIAQIYELGELDGSIFIAMELIRGVNLKELHDRALEHNKPMPISLALKIACGALDALAYAHAFRDEADKPLHIVHRDISPQNILVTYQGEVKIVDFGVAKAEGRLHQTRQGLVKGKFAYMAPEQITGEPIDGRADLFALAEVLYLLTLNRHPFYAETDAAVLQAVVEARPTQPLALDPKFPPQLAGILLRAIQRRPEARYGDAAAMRDAIESFMLDRARPTSQETIGRYVRELFADRLHLEEQARSNDDDAMLVESMRVGAKPRLALPAPREARERPPSVPAELLDTKPPPSRTSKSRGRRKSEPALQAVGDHATDTDKYPIIDKPVDPAEITAEDGDLSFDASQEATIGIEPHVLKGVAAAAAAVGSNARLDVQGRLRVPDAKDDVAHEATVIATDSLAGRPPAPAAKPAPSKQPSQPPKPSKHSKSQKGRSAPAGDAAIAGTKLGKYTLIKRLGTGAMAEVFLATQSGPQGFEKRVALKRILPKLSHDRSFVEMFLREARIAARLTHPNIVQILDLGFEDQQYFLAMEYIHGWDLAKVIEQCRARGVMPPVGIICRIMSEVCAGLDAAHTATDVDGKRMPVLHRDIAPQNVLISMQGGVKLTDFGIATAVGSTDLTGSTEFRGKPEYAAPERLSSEHGTVDPRSDIFSAGTVLYELAVLRPLFKRSTTFETMMAVLREPKTPISAARSDLPIVLDSILDRALARAQGDRTPTAQALQLDLERLLTRLGEPVTSAHVGVWVRQLFSAARDLEEVLTDAAMVLGAEHLESDELTAAVSPLPKLS